MKTINTKSLVIIYLFAGAFVVSSAIANDELFTALDVNADGVIDMKEATAHEVLSENFVEADSNGDGVISREEFASLEL